MLQSTLMWSNFTLGSAFLRYARSSSCDSRPSVSSSDIGTYGIVERLAYTRSQAAEALGISRSTLRRLLPYIETIELPWGSELIPVDELERLVDERRRAPQPRDPGTRGRPPMVSPEVVERIRAECAAGKSLRRIAADLNTDGTPTAHGGQRWWPSTVRAVLVRS
jgi:hypothetical protein